MPLFGRARRAPRAARAAAADLQSQQQQQEQQQQPIPDTLGVVIVDHGSRAAASNDMLLEFVQLYRATTGHALVEPAHMELAEPTIADAIGRCVARGATRVVVAPYFLSRGRHVQKDVPALVAAAAEAHPGVPCTVAEPIGIDPLMVQLISSRVAAATVPGNGRPAAPAARAPAPAAQLQGGGLAAALAGAAAAGAAAAAALAGGV